MEQLSFGLLITDPQAYRAASQRKLRDCLSCHRAFLSEGPGNRICTSCKSSRDAWSGPTAFTAAASF
jgi:hypothetical protein